MDARKKDIDHLEAEIRRLEHQITSESVEAGRRIATLDRSGLRQEELLKYLNSVDTLRRSMEEFRASIDRIRAFTRQIEVSRQVIEENGRRRDQLLRERQSKFVELGAGCFVIYRKLPDPEPYRSYFEDVLKLDSEIEHRHQELRALEAEEKDRGFFDRLKLKARKVMLRGDISRLDREKTAAYDQAGSKIADTDFSRALEGPLRQLFEALQERKRSADLLGSESDRKLQEIENCRRELLRLEVDGQRPDDKVREIEKRIEGLTKELEVMFCWTGQLYLERDLRAEITDSNLAAKFEIVAGLRESIRKKRVQIDRLKAETEIDEITRREKEKRTRRKQLEEEMRVKERQIGVIDIEINMGLRRMEELKRVLSGDVPYTEAPPPPLPPQPDLYPPAEGPPPKPGA
jgi:hypothetical protein